MIFVQHGLSRTYVKSSNMMFNIIFRSYLLSFLGKNKTYTKFIFGTQFSKTQFSERTPQNILFPKNVKNNFHFYHFSLIMFLENLRNTPCRKTLKHKMKIVNLKSKFETKTQSWK